ncbi:hypothetical protein [Neisseria yangbaofengii]|uniref:hypothetical protein n=1 Tax=Neisseria yangbaofengii TaxID=2709396 RepID=UPI001F150240|nr:hypothetical protein [Neisseria yangbaofengii]
MHELLPPKEFNGNLIACWRRLQSGRRIVVHRSLIQITGSLKTAAYLSQLLYWLRVGINVEIRDGWIFKSIAETEEETGLTKREQGLCKDKLVELNLIQVARIGQGARLAVRVNLEALSEAICESFGLTHITQLTIEEWRKQELGFIRDYFSDSIVYHLDLVWLTGDIHAAVILSNALHQSARHANLNNPFMMRRLYYSATIKEWEEATMLGYKPQQRTRTMLKNAGLLVEKHYEQNARIFSHINGARLMAMLEEKISLTLKPEMRLGVLAARKAQTGQDLGSDKLANSEVTKGESQKFRSDDLGKSEVTNRQNIYSNNYNNPPTEDITTTTNTGTGTSQGCDVVVVDTPAPSNGDADIRFDGLAYPSKLSKLKTDCQHIFVKYFPNGSHDQYQEILDEIAGQVKPVNSPLGLLTHLCKQAASPEGLTCSFASIMRNMRIETARMTANRVLPETVAPSETPKEKDFGRKVFADIQKMLKQKLTR